MQTQQHGSVGSFISITLPNVVLAMTALVPLCAGTLSARATDNRAPEVPEAIEVPAGNKVHFHAYAEGVQIYTWNGTAWVFKEPEATLFDNDGNIVGAHYVGPTWESNSGSTVVAARVAGAPVDSTAIPWLLLKATSTSGPGIFKNITYIQRVNTEGGLAPAEPGTFIGEEARVPYAADYFFYRAAP